MTLTWLKPEPGDEFIRTACNSYTIARYPRSSDVPACYIVWKRRAFKANGEWHPDMVGPKFSSVQDAIKYMNGRQAEQ